MLLKPFGQPSPTALRKASSRVEDWSGGTRLGDAIREFNDRWGMRGMARHAGEFVRMLGDIVRNSSFPQAELERGDDPLAHERVWDKLYWTLMPRGRLPR